MYLAQYLEYSKHSINGSSAIVVDAAAADDCTS